MTAEPGSIFVLSMRALAGPENSEPDGRRYDLLVFARAESEQDAEVVAQHGLGQLGWIEPETLRTGEITNPEGVPEDLRSAFQRARTSGCSVIVYDEP